MSQAKKFKELINNTFELSQTVDGVKTVYVSGSDVEFHIKKHFGNVYCYYDNTTDLKADFDQFNRLHIYDFVRLLQALKFDYNPCENFDKYSDITVSHTGTIGTTSNSTMTSKVNAFDSSSLVTDGETVGNGGNTTTLNNSDGTTEHTHGNIGVQTVSNMILQSGTGEAYLRFNNFVEHYLNRWICGCMVAYGDEDNEVEFAQDTEYATKTELETLAQSTSDALNSLTNTVNTQGASITTLDNSLGGVISDIDNNVKPTIEELIEEVDTTSASVTTLEDQLTANNTPIYLDYQNGKYGYNTSSTRGADTFTPFSSGSGTVYKIKMGGVYYALGKYWNSGTGALTTYSGWNAYTLGIPQGATKVHIDNWANDGYNNCNWFATQVSSGNGYSSLGTLSTGNNTINIPSNVSYVRISSTASIMNNVEVWFE